MDKSRKTADTNQAKFASITSFPRRRTRMIMEKGFGLHKEERVYGFYTVHKRPTDEKCFLGFTMPTTAKGKERPGRSSELDGWGDVHRHREYVAQLWGEDGRKY